MPPLCCFLMPFCPRTIALLKVACFACLLAGCRSEAPESPATPSASNEDSTAAAPAAAKNNPRPVVRINTSAGEITLKLDATKAPATVANFLDYVAEGFYEQTMVHFVDPGKMVLLGGFTAHGEPKSTRYSIANEAKNGLKNKRGTVAMARSADAPDSATSQFFINLTDAPQLDHAGDTAEEYGYCVFGEVIDGLDVADRIAQMPTHDQGGDLVQTPQTPVIVESITRVE